jgi:putative ABC transport system ATP-binding protein
MVEAALYTTYNEEEMSNNTPPVIALKHIVKKYGIGDAEHNALDGIDLTVEPGEFIAIMGPSGCGKTTLLNILGLLDRPDDGDFIIDGKNTSQLSNGRRSKIRAKKIGIIFQNFNLINTMTVIDNVALPLTYHGLSRLKRLEAASKILKSFHLQEREYYMPWQLSGGQTQRVAIARALVNQPSLILADEPTGNLDSRSSHVIMEELSEIHKKGNTIIMVTHNPALTSYASRVIHMLDGKIASDKKISVVNKSTQDSTSLTVRRKTSSTTPPIEKTVKKTKPKKSRKKRRKEPAA